MVTHVCRQCNWCFKPIVCGACECCSRLACDECCEKFTEVGGILDLCKQCFDAGCCQTWQKVRKCPIKSSTNTIVPCT